MKSPVLLIWFLIVTAFGQTEEENRTQLEEIFKGFPSQAKSYTAVTAGVGIGKIILGKTPAQIQDILGTPEKCDTTIQSIRMVYHEKNGIDILFIHSRAVEIRFNKGCQYKLESGIKIGSSPNEVFKAYGKPKETLEVLEKSHIKGDGTFYIFGPSRFIGYREKGICFWFNNDGVSQFVISPKRS